MDYRCIDCNRPTPPTRSEQTLLSAAHGWRLTRAQNPDGSVTMQWRCPMCWSRHKKSLATPQALESPRGIFRAATRLFRRDSQKPPTSND
jgi:hypothetical protein